MGNCPIGKSEIDRIDNGKGYSKKNCRWVTAKENSRNMRSNLLLTKHGETKCASEWAEELGVTANALYLRKKMGASDEEALVPSIERRLSDDEALCVFEDYATGVWTQTSLAKAYGISIATVQQITSGRSHSRVTGKYHVPAVARKKRVELEKTPELSTQVNQMLKTMSQRAVSRKLGVSKTVIERLLASG